MVSGAKAPEPSVGEAVMYRYYPSSWRYYDPCYDYWWHDHWYRYHHHW